MAYLAINHVCGTRGLFYSSLGMLGHSLPDWFVNVRTVLAGITEYQLHDLFTLTDQAHNILEGTKRNRLLCMGFDWGLYPWIVGLLGAHSHVSNLQRLLHGQHGANLFQSLLAAILLLDDPLLGEMLVTFLREPKVCSDRECAHEYLSVHCLQMIDLRHGSNWLAKSGRAAPTQAANRMKRAVEWGMILRGGIPTEDRRRFQEQMQRLLDLSTHWQLRSPHLQYLFPKPRPMSSASFEAFLQVPDRPDWHQPHQSLPSFDEIVPTPFPIPVSRRTMKELPVTEAISRLAGRGFDDYNVAEIIVLLQSPQLPHDLEAAIELDIDHRLPVALVEALFLNLIQQYPLYFDYYHRFAIHLLLCSDDNDELARTLYAKGDALRNEWTVFNLGGFSIPMGGDGE